MSKFLYYYLIVIVLTIGTGFNETDSFSSYLKLFHEKELPLTLDREKTFDLAAEVTLSKEIGKGKETFIPDKLRSGKAELRFNAIYMLPKTENKYVVLISRSYMEKYVNFSDEVFEFYLITYDETGTICDYKLVAGIAPDIWEEFLEINKDYTIRSKDYEILYDSSRASYDYSYLLEKVKEYTITESGKIQIIKDEERLGYFDFDGWKGYKYVKKKID